MYYIADWPNALTIDAQRLPLSKDQSLWVGGPLPSGSETRNSQLSWMGWNVILARSRST